MIFQWLPTTSHGLHQQMAFAQSPFKLSVSMTTEQTPSTDKECAVERRKKTESVKNYDKYFV